ncbi:unnamed protein product, partial [Iphiclides podalirius]
MHISGVACRCVRALPAIRATNNKHPLCLGIFRCFVENYVRALLLEESFCLTTRRRDAQEETVEGAVTRESVRIPGEFSWQKARRWRWSWLAMSDHDRWPRGLVDTADSRGTLKLKVLLTPRLRVLIASPPFSADDFHYQLVRAGAITPSWQPIGAERC